MDLILMPQGAVLDVQHGVDNLLEAVRKLKSEDKAIAGDIVRGLAGFPRYLLSSVQAYEMDLCMAELLAGIPVAPVAPPYGASEPPQYDTDGLMAAQAYVPSGVLIRIDLSRQTITAQGYLVPLPMVDWHLETIAEDTLEWEPVSDEPVCCGTTANWPLPRPGWYRAVACLKPYAKPPLVLGISSTFCINAADKE